MPGAPLLDGARRALRAGIIGADGELDRPALAAIAFSDRSRRRTSTRSSTRPCAAEIRRRRGDADTDHVVVLDTPLLTDRRPGYGSARWSSSTCRSRSPSSGCAHRHERGRRPGPHRQADHAARSGCDSADRVSTTAAIGPRLERQVDEVWPWMHTLPASAPVAADGLTAPGGGPTTACRLLRRRRRRRLDDHRARAARAAVAGRSRRVNRVPGDRGRRPATSVGGARAGARRAPTCTCLVGDVALLVHGDAGVSWPGSARSPSAHVALRRDGGARRRFGPTALLRRPRSWPSCFGSSRPPRDCCRRARRSAGTIDGARRRRATP